jgi:hypothetical protein
LKDFTIVAMSTVKSACWQKAAVTRVSERLLLAQSGRSQECSLLGEQWKTFARIELFRF